MASEGHDRIPAGYVRRAHGIGGDVVVRGLLTDSEARFTPGATLISDEDEPREFEITSVRGHQGDYIISFAEIRDRNAADALRGTQFTIDKSDRRELESGEWWPEDLKGCEVVSTTGEVVGRVIDVISGASQDRLVVRTAEGASGEVPFVAELVPEVDVTNQRVIVDLPDGIFE